MASLSNNMNDEAPSPAVQIKSMDEFFEHHPDLFRIEVDFPTLTDDIVKWIDLKMGENDIFDKLSTYLIDATETMLRSYEPPPARGRVISPLTQKHIITIMNKVKANIGKTFREFHTMNDTASYTHFCNTFLGRMTGVEARDLLETLSPPEQCNAVVSTKKRCWICRNGLMGTNREIHSAECEHIFPVSDALLHLDLYQFRSGITTLSPYNQALLQLEYRWAHQCCNQTKSNLQFKKARGSTFETNTENITYMCEKIKEHAEDGTYDCFEIFKGKHGRLDKERFKHLEPQYINKFISPIINTMNNNVKLIENSYTIPRAKAFIVYKYITMIRFFCRIPGNALVEAFKRQFLTAKPLTQQQIRANELKRAAEEKKRLEEERKQQRIQAEKNAKAKAILDRIKAEEAKAAAELQKKIQDKLARAARFAERNNQVIADELARINTTIQTLEPAKTYITSITPPTLQVTTTENDVTNQPTDIDTQIRKDTNQLEEISRLYNALEPQYQTVINDALMFIVTTANQTRSRQEEIHTQFQTLDSRYDNRSDPEYAPLTTVDGGSMTGGTNSDPYAMIQLNFENELHFIMLLAYYPIQLQKMDVDFIEANEYMSTPNILDDAMLHFNPIITKKNDSATQNLSILQKALQQRQRYYVGNQINRPNVSKSNEISVGVAGGKRRTRKRRVHKRRTHKKN